MAIALTIAALVVCQAFALDQKAIMRAAIFLFVINIAALKLTHRCKITKLDKAIYTETLMNRPLAPIAPVVTTKNNYLFEEDRTFVF